MTLNLLVKTTIFLSMNFPYLYDDTNDVYNVVHCRSSQFSFFLNYTCAANLFFIKQIELFIQFTIMVINIFILNKVTINYMSKIKKIIEKTRSKNEVDE